MWYVCTSLTRAHSPLYWAGSRLYQRGDWFYLQVIDGVTYLDETDPQPFILKGHYHTPTELPHWEAIKLLPYRPSYSK